MDPNANLSPTRHSRAKEGHALPELYESQLRGSVNRSAHNHSTNSRTSAHSTPNRHARAEECADPEEWERIAHRRALVKELEADKQRKVVTFAGLMHELGLGTKYKVYKGEVGEAFAELAMNIPVVGLVASSSTESGAQKDNSPINERSYVAGFKRLMASLKTITPNSLPEGHRIITYSCEDYQDGGLGSTPLRPDLVFVPDTVGLADVADVHIILEAKQPMTEKAAYDKYLGQLADYALELKKSQPMRSFIPVLFLYGCQLDLVVFTHSHYRRAHIGPVLDSIVGRRTHPTAAVKNALRDLWFLLSLPANEFGHLGDDFEALGYAQLDMASQPISLRATDMPGESTLDDIALIDSKVHITGRCAYLYRAHFNGDVVVLKLSWTRANRLPEGAVYRALEGRGLSIPTVFHSGLLVENFCGYQLEFLVLQHCGVPIVQHISELRKADRQDSASAVAIKDTVTGCIKEVVETLTMALDFGVLHRDVSAGNLAIKDGKVRIIDWGCAKILERPQDAGLADEISQRWKVDWGATIDAGPHGDPFTGTPLYMSIQMLLRVERRSIFNDIESLFYVILDALSDRERGKIPKDAPGFIFYSDQSAAYMRIGCVSSSNLYLTNFGVNAGNAFVPKDVLDAMHQFLFFERGGFIGDKLQVRAGCDRVVDSTAAAGFMYPATLIRLNELYNEPLKTTQMVSTPTKEQLDDGSPEASHDTMPMAAIAESRLPPPHLDLGRLSLDRGDSGMDPADPFVPGLDIIPEPSAPATSPAASKTRIIKRPRVKQPPPQASGRVLRSMTAGHSAPPAPIDGLNTNTPSTATGASKRGRTETPDDATEQPARNKENKQPRK